MHEEVPGLILIVLGSLVLSILAAPSEAFRSMAMFFESVSRSLVVLSDVVSGRRELESW